MGGWGFISKINAIFSITNNTQKIKRCITKKLRKNKDYVVNKQYKKIVIYRNGQGIIEHSFDFDVLNPSKFKHFYRMLNIEDGWVTASFPTLKIMKGTQKEKRISEYGFWYNSDNDFVDNVEEYYWSKPNVGEIDNISLNNNKELKFKFDINGNKIKSNDVNNLTYSISVPQMFPITNYKYDESKANLKNNVFSTQLVVENDILNIKYVVGFETGFKFKKEPECTITKSSRNHNSKSDDIVGKIRNNNFYTYYEFDIQKLSYNDVIKIKWELED